ncbi:hypothetical protein WCP94_003699 [Bilophila wadsworthia]
MRLPIYKKNPYFLLTENKDFSYSVFDETGNTRSAENSPAGVGSRNQAARPSAKAGEQERTSTLDTCRGNGYL